MPRSRIAFSHSKTRLSGPCSSSHPFCKTPLAFGLFHCLSVPDVSGSFSSSPRASALHSAMLRAHGRLCRLPNPYPLDPSERTGMQLGTVSPHDLADQLDFASAAMLVSQAGPFAARAFLAAPTCPEFTLCPSKSGCTCAGAASAKNQKAKKPPTLKKRTNNPKQNGLPKKNAKQRPTLVALGLQPILIIKADARVVDGKLSSVPLGRWHNGVASGMAVACVSVTTAGHGNAAIPRGQRCSRCIGLGSPMSKMSRRVLTGLSAATSPVLGLELCVFFPRVFSRVAAVRRGQLMEFASGEGVRLRAPEDLAKGETQHCPAPRCRRHSNTGLAGIQSDSAMRLKLGRKGVDNRAATNAPCCASWH